MNAKTLTTCLLAAALAAATACAGVDRRQNAGGVTPPVPPVAQPATSPTDPRSMAVSGEHVPGDAGYLEYYRSTCRIDADAAPDPAALAPAWRNAREVTPEQADRIQKYRSTCNIR